MIAQTTATVDSVADEFYPDYFGPMVSELQVRYQRFAEIREQLLLDYSYNTARAYWGDLEHICIWAMERDKDVLALAENDIRQYVALLRRRKYSDSTIRRRVTALRKMYDALLENGQKEANPANEVVVLKLRTRF